MTKLRNSLPITLIFILLITGLNSSGSPAVTAINQKDSLGLHEVNGKTYILHEVDPGETLYSISRRYGVTVEEIVAANVIAQADAIRVGQVLKIPLPEPEPAETAEENGSESNGSETEETNETRIIQYEVQPGETLYSICQQFGADIEEVARVNHLTDYQIQAGQILLIKTTDKKAEAADTMVFEEPLETVTEEAVEAEPSRENEFSLKYKEEFSSGLYFELEETGVVTWIDDAASFTRGYYALHKSLPVGTVIKVTNLINNRYIYAKVIGNLPETEDNILLKLPLDARDELGIFDQKLLVQVNWLQKKKQ